MPTRAKSQKPPAQEGAAEAKSNSSNENNSKPDTTPHCKTTEESCKCNIKENCSEWVIDSEELLHVEINGIFQVGHCTNTFMLHLYSGNSKMSLYINICYNFRIFYHPITRKICLHKARKMLFVLWV